MKKTLLTIIACCLAIPMFALSPQQKSLVEQNVYQMSVSGNSGCLVPITSTVKGSVSAGHCFADLQQKGVRNYFGINHATKKPFTLTSLNYKPGEGIRGTDYAILSPGGTLKLGDSTNIQKGQQIHMYSPKLGWTSGQITVVPTTTIDPYHFYINIGSCGESGSPVVDDNGNIIGVFVARDPSDGSGIAIRINTILR